MTENNADKLKQQFADDAAAFANKYSLTRLKTYSKHFDREFKRNEDASFSLVSEKAVVTVLGKQSKVAIGENEQYKTYEEAREAMREKWSDYFKKRRANRSEKARRGEQLRQQRYRERRKAKLDALRRQQ